MERRPPLSNTRTVRAPLGSLPSHAPSNWSVGLYPQPETNIAAKMRMTRKTIRGGICDGSVGVENHIPCKLCIFSGRSFSARRLRFSKGTAKSGRAGCFIRFSRCCVERVAFLECVRVARTRRSASDARSCCCCESGCRRIGTWSADLYDPLHSLPQRGANRPIQPFPVGGNFAPDGRRGAAERRAGARCCSVCDGPGEGLVARRSNCASVVV